MRQGFWVSGAWANGSPGEWMHGLGCETGDVPFRIPCTTIVDDSLGTESKAPKITVAGPFFSAGTPTSMLALTENVCTSPEQSTVVSPVAPESNLPLNCKLTTETLLLLRRFRR